MMKLSMVKAGRPEMSSLFNATVTVTVAMMVLVLVLLDVTTVTQQQEHAGAAGAGVSAFSLSSHVGLRQRQRQQTPSLSSSSSTSPLSMILKMSTLAPPESQSLTSFDDDENNNDFDDDLAADDDKQKQKHQNQIHHPKQQSTTVVSVSIDKESFYPPQEKTTATTGTGTSTTTTSATPSTSPATNVNKPLFGPLSMGFDRLKEELGGTTGRAQLVWDCYKVGIDPSNLYGNVVDLSKSWEDYETILSLLPTSRRSQRLSQSTIETLERLYIEQQQQQQQQQSPLMRPKVVRQIENGVATLSYISRSNDGTTKLLIGLQDSLQVECVIIPHPKHKRSTLCISSQVGCRQGCTFCATGRMGRLRNLSADEILAQMFFGVKMCRLEGLPEISNVVFMGMGEPSDNAENVVQATKMLTQRELYQLAASRVTISTVAPQPSSFMQFAQSPCVLAWSVHAVNDDLRKKLVPTTRYPMVELRQGLIDALLMKPMNARTVMLEVALMKGVNDQLEHADELARFTQVIVDSVPGVKPHINLIPYNDIGPAISTKKVSTGSGSGTGISTPPIQYERPDKEDVTAFLKRLQSFGLYTHVRSTRGDDKVAACGQLATKKTNLHSKTMTP